MKLIEKMASFKEILYLGVMVAERLKACAGLEIQV